MGEIFSKITAFIKEIFKKLWLYTVMIVGATLLYVVLRIAIQNQISGINSSAAVIINSEDYDFAYDAIKGCTYLINPKTNQVVYKIPRPTNEAFYVITSAVKSKEYTEATTATTKQSTKRSVSVNPSVTK